MIATYDFKQNTVPSSELSSPSALSDLTRFGLNLDSKLRVHGNMDRTKPELTLQLLITLALKAKKNRQCTIEELMKIIGSMFPYFKKSQNIIGWKKDLTSTLSDATKNKPFVRLTNQVSIYLCLHIQFLGITMTLLVNDIDAQPTEYKLLLYSLICQITSVSLKFEPHIRCNGDLVL